VGHTGIQIDIFCDRVRADPALQEALRKPDDPEQFIALVLTIARDCSFVLGADDVRVAMRPHLSGLPLSKVDERETQLPPEGWLPSGASWRNGRLFVRWAFFGEQRLTEPFFEGDVQRAKRKPFNRLIRYATPIDKLAEWLRDHPGLQPDGFVFHMSRCGSTLVSQMLETLARNVVVSEASLIDTVVRAPQMLPGLSDDQHVRWLRSIVGALGQPRAGTEHNYFIKLDSWHTLALPLFQRAFPDVPWIFMYRDPVEVLVSQLRIPGTQMIPGGIGPNLYGLERSYGPGTAEDYYAQVLAKVTEPAVAHCASGGGLLVNYRQLPDALFAAILPHFGVECGEADRAAMTEAARYDAKAPGLEFMPDSAAKQRGATPSAQAAAEQWLGDLYRRLEVLCAERSHPRANDSSVSRNSER
jgi:hypothetical protein